jgi:hypothetical protein
MAKAYPALVMFAGVIYSLLGENYIGFMITGFEILSDLLNVFAFKKIAEWLYNTWYPDGNCESLLLRPAGTPSSCSPFETCHLLEPTGVCLTDRQIGMFLVMLKVVLRQR